MKTNRSIAFGLALFGVACGTGSELGRPVASFPSKSELEEVLSRDAHPLPTLKTVEVERWEIHERIPAPGAVYELKTPLDAMLKGFVDKQGGRLVLSPALACAARESASFFLEQDAFPSDGLQRYLTSRCGATAPRPRILGYSATVPDSATDQSVQSDAAAKLKQMLPELSKGLAEVGLGYARGKGKAAVILYVGEQRARLDGFSPILTGDRAVLVGEAPSDAVFGVALVNQGDRGVAYCDADRRVKAPRFRFTCPILPTDQLARIEVATRRAEQVLLTPVLSVLMRRSEEAGLTYAPTIPETEGAEAANDPAQFQSSVLGLLNDFRQKGGLRPVSLDAAQSKVNTRFAPYWLDAALAGDDATTQTVALGLLAGWDVQGMIRSGGIYSGYTSSKSPRLWLSYALESPLARWVLFEPETTRLAVGAHEFGPKGMHGVITTYSFFESTNHAADEDAVFAELARVRAARGLPSPQRVAKPPALERALASIASNKTGTGAAFASVIHEVSEQYQLSVRGYIVETSDIKQLEWAEDLLKSEVPHVSVGVTHYKAPGAAWGQYVVLLLIAGDAGGGKGDSGVKEAKRVPPFVRAVF